MRNKIITVYEVILPCVRDEVLREFLSLNKIKANRMSPSSVQKQSKVLFFDQRMERQELAL